MTDVTIVDATPPDVSRVCNVLAEACFDLPQTIHVLPEPIQRRTLLPGLLRLAFIEPAMQDGAVRCTAARMGAAVWVCVTPPGGDSGPVGVMEDRGREQRAHEEAITRAVWLRDLAGDSLYPTVEQFLRLREQARPMDRGPYGWLVAVGVHPRYWRQRNGSALLADFHRHMDAEKRAGYVEVPGDDLIAYFQRFGYQPILDDGLPRKIHFPNGPKLTAMWRDPQPRQPEASPASGGTGAAVRHVSAAKHGDPPSD